ncbi:MAG TPA: hypothetical protein VF339_12410 [Gammaproteobacteria bacterium]
MPQLIANLAAGTTAGGDTGLLQAIEDSGFATWVRESPSLLAYTGVLSLHAIGLAFVVGLSWAVALRLLGVAPEIPLAPARKFFVLMYAAFWVNALSGLALFAASATSLVDNVAFLVKLGFVVLAIVNLRLLKRYAFDEAGLPRNGEPVPAIAKVLAASCLALWGAAIVAGRLTAYPHMLEKYFG